MPLPPQQPPSNLVVVFTNADSSVEMKSLIAKMEDAIGITAVQEESASLPKGAFRYAFADAGAGADDKVVKVAKQNYYHDALKHGPQKVVIDMLPVL